MLKASVLAAEPPGRVRRKFALPSRFMLPAEATPTRSPRSARFMIGCRGASRKPPARTLFGFPKALAGRTGVAAFVAERPAAALLTTSMGVVIDCCFACAEKGRAFEKKLGEGRWSGEGLLHRLWPSAVRLTALTLRERPAELARAAAGGAARRRNAGEDVLAVAGRAPQR